MEDHGVAGPEGPGAGGEAAEQLDHHRRLHAAPPEFPGPPVHLRGVVVAPVLPPSELVAKGVGVDAVAHVLGEALGLPDRIGDALPGSGVLEVPSIADERPARPGRLPEEALPPRGELGRARPHRTLEDRRQGEARGKGIVQAAGLPEAAVIPLVVVRRHHEQAVVGRAPDEVGRPLDIEVQDPVWLDALVVADDAGPLVVGDAVAASAHQPGDRGVAAVGPDDDPGPDLRAPSLRILDADPRHPALVVQQPDNPGPQGHVGPGVLGVLQQDGVEHTAADVEHRHVGVVLGQVDAVHQHPDLGEEGGARGEEPVHDPEAVEAVEVLEQVGGERVAGEVGPLQDTHAHAPPRHVRRQACPGDAATDDHNVVVLVHGSGPFPPIERAAGSPAAAG